jgi:PDZ domain-containing protein
MSPRISRLLYLCMLAAPVIHAQSTPPDKSANATATTDTEQRVRQDTQQMLSRLAASGALGQHPEQVNLHVDQPAQRVTNLGILVDSTSADRARDGLHVLGTTPGSTAEHLGLHPGDIILAVNGTSLRGLGADSDGHALAAMTLKTTIEALPDSAPLQFDIVRAGNNLALNAPLQSVYLPALHMELGAAALADTTSANAAAGEGCGRVSTFDVAPRGDHQYHALILLLDGVTPGPRGGSELYRVSAGPHHLLVAEQIPTQQIGIGDMAAQRRKTSKELDIVVKPGYTSMIAAQFHVDKATNIMNGGYWDPVVWREVAASCP